MKKIPTLFERVYKDHKIVDVLPNVASGMDWVLRGEGLATIKFDGAACAIINNELWKRYDAKKGKPIPEGAIKCQEDTDSVTGHLPCWVKCDKGNPADKWFWKALYNTVDSPHELLDGTYEAIGKHFNGNPYGLDDDMLIPHGRHLVDVERTFEGIKKFLEEKDIEGIVFWKDDKPMCKIKRSDFGFKWGRGLK